MRGVCARAKLTDRYFYEHFDDRDALLVAVWDHARDSVISMLLAAFDDGGAPAPMTRLRAAITSLVHNLADDPGGAQILFSANLGTPVLQRCRQQTLQRLADLLIALTRPYLRDGVDPEDLRMSMLVGIGGFVELVTAWQAGGIEVSGDQLIDHAAKAGDLLLGQYLLPHPDGTARVAWSVLATMEASAAPGADPPAPDGQDAGAEQR